MNTGRGNPGVSGHLLETGAPYIPPEVIALFLKIRDVEIKQSVVIVIISTTFDTSSISSALVTLTFSLIQPYSALFFFRTSPTADVATCTLSYRNDVKSTNYGI
jgi:hypothetical protein